MKLTTFMQPVVIFTYDCDTQNAEFQIDWESADEHDLVLNEANDELWFKDLSEEMQKSIDDGCTKAIAAFVDENPDHHDKTMVSWAESYMHKIRPFDQLVPVVFGSDSDDMESFWA